MSKRRNKQLHECDNCKVTSWCDAIETVASDDPSSVCSIFMCRNCLMCDTCRNMLNPSLVYPREDREIHCRNCHPICLAHNHFHRLEFMQRWYPNGTALCTSACLICKAIPESIAFEQSEEFAICRDCIRAHAGPVAVVDQTGPTDVIVYLPVWTNDDGTPSEMACSLEAACL